MIFFIHIPKAAGTSVLHELQRLASTRVSWYGPGNFLSEFFARPKVRERVSIYGGHFGLDQLRPYLEPGDKIFSLIREPIQRTFSFYNHVRIRDRNHPFHVFVQERSIIEAAGANTQFRSELENYQCYFVSGSRLFETARDVIHSRRVFVYNIEDMPLMLRGHRALN